MTTEQMIALNIKKIISDRGLKQKSVAEKSGFNETEFSNLLNGRKIMKATYIPTIAETLGVSPNILYGYKAS